MLFRVLLVSLFASAVANAEPPTDFDSAKDDAVELWWEIGPASFYCQCPYRLATDAEKQIRSGNLWIVGSVCGYQAKELLYSSGRPNARSTRIDWEHIVPAEWIATGFGCQEGSRSDCRAIEGFEEAEGDLYNLVPAIGELNGDRSARLFGLIEGESRAYGACDFEVDDTGPGETHTRGMAEPMESIRGDVARVWFYMIDRYGLQVPRENRTLLEAWAEADPVDRAELRRASIIEAEMGWANPYVSE